MHHNYELVDAFDAGVIEGKRQSQDKIDRLLEYATHTADCCMINLVKINCDCGLDNLIEEIEGGQ